MSANNELSRDGMDIIRYLDKELQTVRANNKLVTGIVIGSAMRKALTAACQKTMGQSPNPEETVNRFMNALLIEDGVNVNRLEVISGPKVIPPVEHPLLGRGL